MSDKGTPARAIVARGVLNDGGWKLEDITVRPIKDDELLIEVVASGICHSDILIGSHGDPPMAFFPRVFGHEGAGYVKAVGSAVTVAQPGDPVLLSFCYCGSCHLCTTGHPSYCLSFALMNFFTPAPAFFTAGQSTQGGAQPDIHGSFFGQSSFASTTIAAASSVVNVKGLVHSREELALFAPLGCGVQTGSGTILHVADAQASDTVAVVGLGGVGLSGIIAAKLRGCKRIIGIDKVKSRLDLAKELGATDVIDTTELGELSELVKRVQDVTDGIGPSVTMEATGFLPLVKLAVEFTRVHGKILQVGVDMGGSALELPLGTWVAGGKQYIGAIEGDSIPKDFLPEMIGWYREGKFPIDKFIKVMKAEDWETALKEMHDGSTVKPVITW